MDQAEHEKYLKIWEQIPGKIDSLVDAGISIEDQAQKFDVLESSVKSWRLGAALTERSLAKLDQLVNTVDSLVEQGHTPAEAASLLKVLDYDEYTSGFDADASVPQRVAALSFAGFSKDVIADAAGVKSTATVDRWLKGETNPRGEAVNKLNDLRFAMNSLLEAGLEPDAAAIWLQSPLTDNNENIPIDELGRDPEIVFRALDILFVRPYKPNSN